MIREDIQKKQITKMLELVDAVGFDGMKVFTGDFNLNSSKPGYKMMQNAGYIDSFNLAQKSTEENAAGMIDFCFARADGSVVAEHCVVREMFDGLYPSDHRAVYSVIIPYVRKD